MQDKDPQIEKLVNKPREKNQNVSHLFVCYCDY